MQIKTYYIEQNRQVSFVEGLTLAERENMMFMEASARLGSNVYEVKLRYYLA